MLQNIHKTTARIATATLMTASFALPATSAMAADSTAQAFQVKSASDGNIRAGAQAFKKGQYEKSAMFSRIAVKSSLSNKREAIAQSNLCAAYGAMGDMESAKLACTVALKLRPGYEPAEANSQAITYKLAQK